MLEDNIPLLDCPVDFLIGDASGKVMNEYARFPCKIKCGVFALMARGSAKATINVTQYEFNQNDVLMLESGSFLQIHKLSDDALVYYILASSAFLDKNTIGRMHFQAPQLQKPLIHLSAEKAEIVADMAALLIKASNTTPSMLDSEKMVHVFNLIQTAYASFIRQNGDLLARPQDRRTAIYQDYVRLVLDHYQEWHHVTNYAEAMHLTTPHLCSTIKQVSKKTAGDIINDAILTDAKAQLKITKLQIKEIALSLGFENVAFFNRFFKTHTGLTPKSYRMSDL